MAVSSKATNQLTPKQEKFAQCVASGMSQADAYRNSARIKSTTKDKTMQEAASRMMADCKIRARVAEIRQPVVQEVQITLKGHLATLADIRDRALEASQFSAASTAEIARGKASGLYSDKVELTGKDGAPIEHNLTVSFINKK